MSRLFEQIIKKSPSPSKRPSTNRWLASSSRKAPMGSAQMRHAAVQLEAYRNMPGACCTSPHSPAIPFSCLSGARRSCLSSSSRAMTRCPSSAGRGLSTSLAFGVAKALLVSYERHARTQAVRFPGYAPYQRGCVGMVLSGVCQIWCYSSRGSECVTNESIHHSVKVDLQGTSTSCTKRHDPRPNGHLSVPHTTRRRWLRIHD